MPFFNPEIHHRRSIRLQEYDYATEGAYFVTINAYQKEHILGRIVNGEADLTEVGQIVRRWWSKLPSKFASCRLDEFIVMPNHVHFILWIVRADPCVCPRSSPRDDPGRSAYETPRPDGYAGGEGGRMGPPVPKMIQWFKTMTTNEYIRLQKSQNPNQVIPKLWHRNYYERIIRSDRELDEIRKYILENPLKWDSDPENKSAS